jgi:hypothetical protein
LLAAIVIASAPILPFQSKISAQTSARQTLLKLCEIERKVARVAMGARKSGLTRDQAVDELLESTRDKDSYVLSEMIGTWIRLYDITYMERYALDPDEYARIRYRKCIEKYL